VQDTHSFHANRSCIAARAAYSEDSPNLTVGVRGHREDLAGELVYGVTGEWIGKLAPAYTVAVKMSPYFVHR
jgi:hypothetical protein